MYCVDLSYRTQYSIQHITCMRWATDWLLHIVCNMQRMLYLISTTLLVLAVALHDMAKMWAKSLKTIPTFINTTQQSTNKRLLTPITLKCTYAKHSQFTLLLWNCTNKVIEDRVTSSITTPVQHTHEWGGSRTAFHKLPWQARHYSWNNPLHYVVVVPARERRPCHRPYFYHLSFLNEV